MRYFFLSILLLASFNAHSQKLVSNKEEILATNQKMKPAIDAFFSCIAQSDLGECVSVLIKTGDTDLKKFVVANVLYGIDPQQSLRLHKEVHLAKPESSDFMLEYAIELQRNGNYKEAAELYEKYMVINPDDFRVNVWLADCYINTGENKKAIANWEQADHEKHHVSIDLAINTIYNESDQYQKRNEYRKEIEKGNLTLFYPLFFLDMNWVLDWWNSDIQMGLLKEDVKLLEEKTEKKGAEYQTLIAYMEIKKLSLKEDSGEKIKAILSENKIVTGTNPFPPNGQVTSDLLRIALLNSLISEKEFFAARGAELLRLAQSTKDAEVLNVYVYLQSSANGSVDLSVEKMGWTDFKDERFAIGYFNAKADSLLFDDMELANALSDFPNSAGLYRTKVDCANRQKMKLSPLLPELIRREFKTFGSDAEHFSYALKSYFGFLKMGK